MAKASLGGRPPEFIVKGGAVEEYGTFEFKHGLRINEDTGFYLYLGVGKYTGAKSDDTLVTAYDGKDNRPLKKVSFLT